MPRPNCPTGNARHKPRMGDRHLFPSPKTSTNAHLVRSVVRRDRTLVSQHKLMKLCSCWLDIGLAKNREQTHSPKHKDIRRGFRGRWETKDFEMHLRRFS